MPKKPTATIKKTGTVARRARPLRESKYTEILGKIGKLKPGKVLVLSLPRGTSPRQMQVRLASIEDRRIKQGLLKLPKGYRIAHFTTEDNDLAVELVKA